MIPIDRVNRNFYDLGLSRVLPDNLKERALQAATLAFRYAALATVAGLSTYFLGPSFFRVSLLSSWVLGGAAIYSSATLLRGEFSVEQIARRTDHAARVILWSLMIVGALSAGLTLGGCFSGATLLYAGTQAKSTWMILGGLRALTFYLGFALPLSEILLSNSTFFYERYDSWVNQLKALIADYQTNPEETTLRMLRIPLDYLDLELPLSYLESLPTDIAQKLFEPVLTFFSDEKISGLITRIPNILTTQFLLQTLPTDRFERIVLPRFNCPVTREQLDAISDDIDAKELQIIEGFQEAKEIRETLGEYNRKLQQLHRFIETLPEQRLPEKYAGAQEKIDAARALKAKTEQLLTNLANEEEGSLWSRLEAFEQPDAEIVPVTSNSRWVKVSHLANHVFHIALIGGTLALNFYYSPRSTATGLIASGFIRFPTPDPLRARIALEAPVDYIRLGFSARMRTLYFSALGLSLSLWFGALGGLVAGASYGSTVFSYAAALRGRVQRQPNVV